MGINRLAIIALGCILGIQSGCAGQRPFLVVQLCLRDQQSVDLFKNVVKSIAQSKRMKFIDGSTRTQEELSTLKVAPKFHLIYIGVDGADGVGMEGGNLGLSAYEVAIGFSEGSNPAEAHRFADEVIGELKKRWPIYVLPPGRGALPMRTCQEPIKQGR